MSPPLLIHIGYPKTATTWLQARFFDRKAVGFRLIGRPGAPQPARDLVAARPFRFDADESRSQFQAQIDSALQEQRQPVLSFERLCGHPASGGFDAEVIADRLAVLFPEARILVFIRAQHAMIASTYKQYVKAGGPCSLPEFLEPTTSPSRRVPWFDYDYFEYHHLIGHYQTRFGRESVLAVPYERFLAEPVEVLVEIARFAERPLERSVLESFRTERRKRGSFDARTTEIWRRVNRLFLRSEVHQAPALTSAALARTTRSLVMRAGRDPRLLGRPAEDRERALREQVERLVGDRYVESNRATAELIGVDLAAYGWTV